MHASFRSQDRRGEEASLVSGCCYIINAATQRTGGETAQGAVRQHACVIPQAAPINAAPHPSW